MSAVMISRICRFMALNAPGLRSRGLACDSPRDRSRVALGFALALMAMLFCLPAAMSVADDDLDAGEQEQAALEAAVNHVAPAVVRIETVGGLERIGRVLLGTGPTTGLVVDPSGYIVSSAFNFVNKPASIIVRLPDGSRKPAKLVATDHSRMLVLLKIDVEKPLPVCEIAPRGEMRVGQWTIAVGRTFESERPNMAVGILSALSRIHGKAIQTDAAVSPNNYGGPLVDIRGQVMGVLVPLSSKGNGEMAGMEWYDSGIGFAIPAEHVQRMLPRLKKGEDLFPGLTGITLKGPHRFPGPAGRTGIIVNGLDLSARTLTVVACRQKSPAAIAGIKRGDQLVEIDGRPITCMVEFKDELGRRYAGEKVQITLLRGEQRIQRELELAAKLEPFQHGFLGVLPMRSAEKEGVTVRHVYPNSPAAAAGVAVGDKLISLDGKSIRSRIKLIGKIGVLEPGTEVELEVGRGDDKRKLKVTLASLPEDLPPKELPAAVEPPKSNAKSNVKSDVSGKKAKAAQPKVLGAAQLEVPKYPNEVQCYVPVNYRSDVPYGVVVWLHARDGLDWKELLSRWKPLCDDRDLILVAPKSADPDRWTSAEAALVDQLLKKVGSMYRVDPTRIVVYGYGASGSLAFKTAFRKSTRRNPNRIRAVAVMEAAPLDPPSGNTPQRRLAVYLAWDNSGGNTRSIERAVAALCEVNIPVIVKNIGETSPHLNAEELAELVRWIDMLDRI